jgi:hypothetical protein
MRGGEPRDEDGGHVQVIAPGAACKAHSRHPTLEADTDEYDEWQLRIARIEAIHTLDDVYTYAEAYVIDSDEFLLGWGL